MKRKKNKECKTVLYFPVCARYGKEGTCRVVRGHFNISKMHHAWVKPIQSEGVYIYIVTITGQAKQELVSGLSLLSVVSPTSQVTNDMTNILQILVKSQV